MGKISENCADDIIRTSVGTTNIPHPSKDGMRIVGWVVPEKEAQLSVGLIALDDIAECWKKSRKPKYFRDNY